MSNFTECPYCGTEISKTVKKCPFCKARLKKPFFKRGWFIFILLVLIFGGGGYYAKERFGLDYVAMAHRASDWVHSIIAGDSSEVADVEGEVNNETDASVETAESDVTEGEITEDEENVPKESMIVITAEELTQAYEGNVFAGNRHYRGETLRVNGVIKAFGESGGRAFVILKGWSESSFVGVRCFVDSLEDMNELAEMVIGDEITIEGECTGMNVNVDLDPAYIAIGDDSDEEKEIHPLVRRHILTLPEEPEAETENSEEENEVITEESEGTTEPSEDASEDLEVKGLENGVTESAEGPVTRQKSAAL